MNVSDTYDLAKCDLSLWTADYLPSVTTLDVVGKQIYTGAWLHSIT